MEYTPLPGTTLEPDFSAHELDQCSANSQTETGSAILAGGRAIRLDKRFEDKLLFIFRYPYPGIMDRKVQRRLTSTIVFAVDFYCDLPARGELNRVIDEIRNDLLQPRCVAHECLWYQGVDPHGD